MMVRVGSKRNYDQGQDTGGANSIEMLEKGQVWSDNGRNVSVAGEE